MSLRLPETLAADVALVARADGMHISEVMRRAAAEYVAARSEQDDFQERLTKFAEADSKAIERLRK